MRALIGLGLGACVSFNALGAEADTRDIEDAIELLNSIKVEASEEFDAPSEDVELLEGLEDELEESKYRRLNLDVPKFTTQVNFYDRVNRPVRIHVKNNTGVNDIEISRIGCLVEYKTRLGSDVKEESEQHFSGKTSYATWVGRKRLCTRGFVCRYEVKVVGCREQGCSRVFSPTAWHLDQAGDDGKGMCILDLTLKFKI